MKKIVFTFMVILCSITVVSAQEKEKKESGKDNLLVKLQEGAKPVIYVDGKVFDFPMELIDQSKIASVMVVKKQEALKKYKAPNGVILIQTKKGKEIDLEVMKVKEGNKIGGKNAPKVIIDGKISDQATLKSLNPNDIEKMEVVKGEQAIKKYKAPNGVIIITTKKE